MRKISEKTTFSGRRRWPWWRRRRDATGPPRTTWNISQVRDFANKFKFLFLANIFNHCATPSSMMLGPTLVVLSKAYICSKGVFLFQIWNFFYYLRVGTKTKSARLNPNTIIPGILINFINTITRQIFLIINHFCSKKLMLSNKHISNS